MTHIDMSQSAKSYFRARRYDPFPAKYEASFFTVLSFWLVSTQGEGIKPIF